MYRIVHWTSTTESSRDENCDAVSDLLRPHHEEEIAEVRKPAQQNSPKSNYFQHLLSAIA